MIPVITASAPRLSESELEALHRLFGASERFKHRGGDPDHSWADLAAALPLAERFLLDWSPSELAADGGAVVLALGRLIAWGLPPRRRQSGESSWEYAREVERLAVLVALSPISQGLRNVGQSVRRFAREPVVATVLADPLGLVRTVNDDLDLSPDFDDLVVSLIALEMDSPRPKFGEGTNAGLDINADGDGAGAGDVADDVDRAAEAAWEAQQKKARDEDKARAEKTLKDVKSGALDVATYCPACAPFALMFALALETFGPVIVSAMGFLEDVFGRATGECEFDDAMKKQLQNALNSIAAMGVPLPPMPPIVTSNDACMLSDQYEAIAHAMQLPPAETGSLGFVPQMMAAVAETIDNDPGIGVPVMESLRDIVGRIVTGDGKLHASSEPARKMTPAEQDALLAVTLKRANDLLNDVILRVLGSRNRRNGFTTPVLQIRAATLPQITANPSLNVWAYGSDHTTSNASSRINKKWSGVYGPMHILWGLASEANELNRKKTLGKIVLRFPSPTSGSSNAAPVLVAGAAVAATAVAMGAGGGVSFGSLSNMGSFVRKLFGGKK